MYNGEKIHRTHLYREINTILIPIHRRDDKKTRRYDTIFEGNTYKSWKKELVHYTNTFKYVILRVSFTVVVAASGQSLNRVQNNTRFHFTFIEWFLFWLILPVFNWIFLLYCFYLNFLLLLPLIPATVATHTKTHTLISVQKDDGWLSTTKLCESGRVFFFFFVWCYCYFFFLVISFVIHIHFFTYFF